MHKRGLALLEAGDEIGAKAMLGELLAIDPGAARWSTEIAGLKGRLFWQRHHTGLGAAKEELDLWLAALVGE